MSFLVPFATSLFSSPLVSGTLGSIASSGLNLLKGYGLNLLREYAGSLLTQGVKALTDQATNYTAQASDYLNNKAELYSNNWRNQDMDEEIYEEDNPPPRVVRSRPKRSRSVKKRVRPNPYYQNDPPPRRRGRQVVYDPDAITDYET